MKQKIVEICNRTDNQFGYIYMFHDVNDSCIDESIYIHPINFKKWIEEKLKKNIKFIPITQVLSQGNNGTACITFDDGYLSAFSNAIPYLEKCTIPYCCFITLEYLDRQGYIRSEHLHELNASELCTIGAHGIKHPFFRNAIENVMKDEILGGKEELQKILQKEIRYFAYPYGSLYACSPKSINIVSNAGYEAAFSTISVPLGKKLSKNKFFLPRININDKNWTANI